MNGKGVCFLRKIGGAGSKIFIFVREKTQTMSKAQAQPALDTEAMQRVLLRLINDTVLSPEKRALYLELVQKLEKDTISEQERQHFLELTEEEEDLRNERVKLLIELAQIRNVPLNQVMEELGLQPVGHG